MASTRAADAPPFALRAAHLGHVPDELLAHRSCDLFVERVPVRLATTTVATVKERVTGLVVTHRDPSPHAPRRRRTPIAPPPVEPAASRNRRQPGRAGRTAPRLRRTS